MIQVPAMDRVNENAPFAFDSLEAMVAHGGLIWIKQSIGGIADLDS